MICPNCGNNNPDDANVCSACGAPQQPAQTVYQAPVQPVQENGKSLAIASLVLGIISFIIMPYIAGALAIVLGAVAKKQGCKSGMATAGIVLGIVGIVLQIIASIFFTSVITAMFSL